MSDFALKFHDYKCMSVSNFITVTISRLRITIQLPIDSNLKGVRFGCLMKRACLTWICQHWKSKRHSKRFNIEPRRSQLFLMKWTRKACVESAANDVFMFYRVNIDFSWDAFSIILISQTAASTLPLNANVSMINFTGFLRGYIGIDKKNFYCKSFFMLECFYHRRAFGTSLNM